MRLLVLFLLIPLCGAVFAQPEENRREVFSEGEYFFDRGDYTEAAYYFKQLVASDPDNGHFNFRLGECYMNIPGSETLALPFFEKSVRSTVGKKKYHSRDVEEKTAPLHAWFYLGNVYRIAGKLDMALNAYKTFLNSPFYFGNYNENVVENEIKSCERAKIIMDSPVDALIEAMDSSVNTSASEIYPVVSSDEQTLVFIRRLKFYDAILMVSKEGDSWGNPVNLNPLIGSDGDFYPVSFSPDGNMLYLMRSSGENKDLYVSHRRNGIWNKAEPLGKSVNSIADETWACVSDDGTTLWFTSSRKKGQGGFDIYYATLDKNHHWGKVKNAGKIINTQFDEESPCISNHDGILYFSSRGHYSMGGYDIFYSKKDGKSWRKPVNIGFPINNTSDNTGYIPTAEGNSGYYSLRETGRCCRCIPYQSKSDR